MQDNAHKIAILLNPWAGHGRALQRWQTVAGAVGRQLAQQAAAVDIFEAGQPGSNAAALAAAGYTVLLAAGGDGSVNYLLQELMALEGARPLLGAIGLGSSNDFHKPLRAQAGGVPLRIAPALAQPQDVGRVLYRDENGQEQQRYFLINASLGVTADANWLFNHPDGLLGLLKGRSTSLAILYAAVSTILRHRNSPLELVADDQLLAGKFANVAVLKSVHVSGSFTYDQQLRSDDGRLGLNTCGDISRRQLLGVLADLSRGRFSGKKGRRLLYVQQLQIRTFGLQALETDGEVMLAEDIRFSLLPKALHVIQSGPQGGPA
jgi:diacylglycerol kinase (ATP)